MGLLCIIGRNYINMFDIMGLIALMFYIIIIIIIISLIIHFSSFSLYNNNKNNNIKPVLYSNIPTATAGHSLGHIVAPYF